MMRKRTLLILTAFVMTMILPICTAYGANRNGSHGVSGLAGTPGTASPPAMSDAAKKITVTLPTFPVTLNGLKLDNSTSQFPLLVYRDVTYFPMTFYDCGLLGIETQWDQKKGLSIDKHRNHMEDYNRYQAAAPNEKTQIAELPDFPIQVNGKEVDNKREPYPIFVFREVTYFPLTWQYAVKQFGWDYHFDAKKGLTINSDATNGKNPSHWRVDPDDTYVDPDGITIITMKRD